MNRLGLEICVDTPDGLDAAIAGGADRIELCAALDLGGLTPAPGLIARARAAPCPVRVMIRPRAGDFVWSAADIAAMRTEIAAVRTAGLEGVVLGASLRDGRLDEATLAALVADAHGLGLTLHRAIDRTPDSDAALDTAIRLGFDCVLTSGGTPSLIDGLDPLARLVARAGDRIAVMAGGGVRADNAAEVARRTGARWIHASGREAVPHADPRDAAFGFAPPLWCDTSRMHVRALRDTLDGLAG